MTKTVTGCIFLLLATTLVACGENRPQQLEAQSFYVTGEQRSDVIWTSIDVSAGTESQGDAHLIYIRNGARILIDGGTMRSAIQELVPFLKKHNIDSLDQVFISHPHSDHYDGILLLLKMNFPIKEIIWNEPSQQECQKESFGCVFLDIQSIKRLAVVNGVRLIEYKDWQESDYKSLSGMNVKLVKIAQVPLKNCPGPGSCSLNDTSAVIRLEVGSHRVLFTGDLDQQVSHWLAINRKDELKADFLKVPHHGTASTSSDDFFEAVSPTYAIVPAPQYLWCSERSKRVRSHLAETIPQIFVNGTQGHIFVHFMSDDSVRVKTEHPDDGAFEGCPNKF